MFSVSAKLTQQCHIYLDHLPSCMHTHKYKHVYQSEDSLYLLKYWKTKIQTDKSKADSFVRLLKSQNKIIM